jgi:hypothetical protein
VAVGPVHDPVADTPPCQAPFGDLVQLQTAAVVAAARVGWARINAYLVRWIRDKYETTVPTKNATARWQRITSQPWLFAHLPQITEKLKSTLRGVQDYPR